MFNNRFNNRAGFRITLFLISSVALISSLTATAAAVDGGAPPANSVVLTATPPSPQPSGTQVVIRAAASGGSGSYEYMFWGRPAGAPTWSPLQGYSAINSCTWRTGGVFLGSYEIKVDARNLGSTAAFEASQSMTYIVTVPSGTGPH